jgi:cytochrome c biogenesis protein CcdA
VLQTSIHALSLYPLNTELLAKISPCLLAVLDAFHSFNHEVNVKRKDIVSMMT